MKHLPIIFLILVLILVSTLGVNEVNASDSVPNTNTTTNKKGEDMAGGSSTYDFVISFISIGSGIDQTVLAKLRIYLESLGSKVSYEAISWGMEGEIDYCININERSDSDRADIHKKLVDICGGTSLVAIEMNAACSHLNWSK